MTISIISAVDKNYLIGKQNELPWHLPADFVYFKNKTKGKIVIMGSKTYNFLPENFRPLPGRKNVVLSRKKNKEFIPMEEKKGGWKTKFISDNIREILSKYPKDEEIFVIGGAQIYELFLEKGLIDKIYLTQIDGEFKGDIYFPNKFMEKFQEVSRKTFKKDEKNLHNMDFVVYKKK